MWAGTCPPGQRSQGSARSSRSPVLIRCAARSATGTAGRASRSRTALPRSGCRQLRPRRACRWSRRAAIRCALAQLWGGVVRGRFGHGLSLAGLAPLMLSGATVRTWIHPLRRQPRRHNQRVPQNLHERHLAHYRGPQDQDPPRRSLGSDRRPRQRLRRYMQTPSRAGVRAPPPAATSPATTAASSAGVPAPRQSLKVPGLRHLGMLNDRRRRQPAVRPRRDHGC